MSRKLRTSLFCSLLGLSCAWLCLSCSSSSKHLTSYAYGFGTTWDIHLYQGSQEDCDTIVSLINQNSSALDVKKTTNTKGLYYLNQENHLEDADPFLLEALALGDKLEQECGEAFSYSIGKLTSAWLAALEEGKVLDESTKVSLLEEAKQTKVNVSGKSITKTGSGQIDLGAIGKGLCLNKIGAYLQEKGITQYLIDGGSSSFLIGETPDQKPIKVNLNDAKGHYFYAKNCAISASSISRQGVKIDGVTYSHIIDPRNGNAAVSQDALYLLGQDAGYLDGLSTAYLVLGEEGGEALSKKGLSYCYCKDGKVSYASEGFVL